MKEELVTFDTAKLAKEKGFNEPVLAIYSGNQLGYIQEGDTLFKKWNHCTDATYSAPTQSLLQKWLREVHNIDVVISPERYKNGVNYMVQAQKWDLNANEEIHPNFVVKGSYWFNDNHEHPTYEEALEKGLQEALKLI